LLIVNDLIRSSVVGEPIFSSSSEEMTSTGSAASSAVPRMYEPVTMTTSATSLVSCASAVVTAVARIPQA
jgi:hypothetical protein